jgi:ribonuclease I
VGKTGFAFINQLNLGNKGRTVHNNRSTGLTPSGSTFSKAVVSCILVTQLKRAFMKKLLLLLCVLSLAACAASPAAKKIKPTKEYNVKNCTYLGTVHSWPGGFCVAISPSNAKNQCLNKAAEMGATHIVWTDADSGWGVSATGEAYRCQ